MKTWTNWAVAILIVAFSGINLLGDTITLIPRYAVWSLLDNGSNQGTAWRSLGYTETGWRTGAGEFGYGDGDETTIVSYGPNASGKYITTYFRKTFVLTNAVQFTNLVLNLLRDDGAVVYLNGTEVARQNMPAGTISYTTTASISIPAADEVTFFPATVNPALLVNGTNLVAVEVHQNGPQTSDMSFNFELVGAFTSNAVPPTVALVSPAPDSYFYSASNILLSASAVASSGVITNVTFLSGTNVIGSDGSAPFQFSWLNAPPGTHAIVARASDSLGQVSDSVPQTLYVLANDAPWPVIIPVSGVWKYLDNGTDQGTAWRSNSFNDASWANGAAQLGYGDGDEATVISYGPSATARYITSYFRRSFVLAANARYTNVYMRILRDDGAIVFLNGTEVFRSNMRAGNQNYLATALVAIGGSDETTFTYRSLDPGLLIPGGTNVVAVEIHQNAADSSDVSFDFELTGNVPGPDSRLLVEPGQRGLVRCVDHPDVAYDLYLPPGYSSNGPARPLLYTFHANGGGMVGDFQSVASSLQFIVVGILESQNGVDWDQFTDVTHAVTRDIRQRLNYDPTAVFAAGWSGGAVSAYEFSKYLRQELSGVFAMSGWLQNRTNNVDRFLTNLCVARASGDTDTAATFYLPIDARHLTNHGAIIRDTIFSGGHVVAPNAVKSDCLSWMLSVRLPAGPNDRTNALAQAALWRTALQNGGHEQVYRACVNSVMTRPRTYEAREAHLVLEAIYADYERFRLLNVAGAASSDYALDHFFFRAYGAGKIRSKALYYSALKAATGVTGTSGDRLTGFGDMLRLFGIPAPLIRRVGVSGPEVDLTYAPDSLAAQYSWEQKTLSGGTWAPVSGAEVPAPDGTRSVTVPMAPEPRLFRLGVSAP